MPNRNYNNGRAKETRIVNKARAKGYIAFRSAGSHSPIDVVIISPTEQRIWLIQSKLGKLSRPEKERILEELKGLEGMYSVTAHIIEKNSNSFE